MFRRFFLIWYLYLLSSTGIKSIRRTYSAAGSMPDMCTWNVGNILLHKHKQQQSIYADHRLIIMHIIIIIIIAQIPNPNYSSLVFNSANNRPKSKKPHSSFTTHIFFRQRKHGIAIITQQRDVLAKEWCLVKPSSFCDDHLSAELVELPPQTLHLQLDSDTSHLWSFAAGPSGVWRTGFWESKTLIRCTWDLDQDTILTTLYEVYA